MGLPAISRSARLFAAKARARLRQGLWRRRRLCAAQGGRGRSSVMVPKDGGERLIARIVYTGPVPAPVKAGPADRRAEGLARRQCGAGTPLHARGATSASADLPQRAFDAVTEHGDLALFRAGRRGYDACQPAPADRREAEYLARTLHHLRRRRRQRQVHARQAARATSAIARHRGGADARARRLAGRRDHPPHHLVRRRQAAGGGDRDHPVRRRARRSRAQRHPAGAGRGQMGDLRPLHQFHPRLSGRARQGRS